MDPLIPITVKYLNMIELLFRRGDKQQFSMNWPLGRFFLVIAMSVHGWLAVSPSHAIFVGLSLALRSHDQIRSLMRTRPSPAIS